MTVRAGTMPSPPDAGEVLKQGARRQRFVNVGAMSRLRPLALVALALSVTLTLPAVGQAASRHKPKPTQQIYVSLGDSYAVGYQPTAPHVGSTTTNGYANQLLPLAKAKGYTFKLVNFGCGGATTTSILQTPGCAANARAVG